MTLKTTGSSVAGCHTICSKNRWTVTSLSHKIYVIPKTAQGCNHLPICLRVIQVFFFFVADNFFLLLAAEPRLLAAVICSEIHKNVFLILFLLNKSHWRNRHWAQKKINKKRYFLIKVLSRAEIICCLYTLTHVLLQRGGADRQMAT